MVIGSGPSGSIAASALLDYGLRVGMIDRGLKAEKRVMEAAELVGQVPPSSWTPDQVSFMRSAVALDEKGLPRKRPFGSDFLVAESDTLFTAGKAADGFALRGCFAAGGFSNVWGAALLRMHAKDFREWPIAQSELTPHYEAVESVLPVSAQKDALLDVYPTTLNRDAVEVSPQGAELLRKFCTARSKLSSLGATVGRSRLAVSASCHRCGYCMSACPYGLIFNSADLLAKLRRNPRFGYLGGLRADRLVEHEDSVSVFARDMEGHRQEIKGARIFCGAGPLNTAMLMLSSFPERCRSVSLRDSQYFALPFASPGVSAGATPSNTLAQLFLEISDDELSSHPIHNQLYTHDELFGAIISQRMPSAIRGLLHPVSRTLAKRLMVIQGYLHSTDSPSAMLSLKDQCLSAVVTPNLRTREMIRKVWERLGRIGRTAGMWAMPWAGTIADLGAGYHSGATFPMSNSLDGNNTDLLGRAFGLRRVHLIDASSLPDIPSTAITLTIMANAHRIATVAGRH